MWKQCCVCGHGLCECSIQSQCTRFRWMFTTKSKTTKALWVHYCPYGHNFNEYWMQSLKSLKQYGCNIVPTNMV
jgi:hypothetical protein